MAVNSTFHMQNGQPVRAFRSIGTVIADAGIADKNAKMVKKQV
jgi:hypothetical protein